MVIINEQETNIFGIKLLKSNFLLFLNIGVEDVNTIVACEDTTLRLSCKTGTVIHIISSTYGRLDRLTCPPDVPEPATAIYDGCQEKSGLRVVREKCENNLNCNVLVAPGSFGTDGPPWCTHKSNKYLKVTYGCIKGK